MEGMLNSISFILHPSAFILSLLPRRDGHVEREAADARARARLGEAQVCELDEPCAALRRQHARHGEAREAEQHARTLVRSGALDQLARRALALLDAEQAARVLRRGPLAEREVEAQGRPIGLREAAPRE